MEQAAGDTVAGLTAAANAAVNDGVSLEYNDWSGDAAADTEKDLNSNLSSGSSSGFPPSTSTTSNLPFAEGRVSLPTEPCPPSDPGLAGARVTSVANTFTTSASVNFINQNTAPYTSNHPAAAEAAADQKAGAVSVQLWPEDSAAAAMSSLMMSPGSLQLPSSTLDLSSLDIKWGILDQEPAPCPAPCPAPAPPIKREQEKTISLASDIQ